MKVILSKTKMNIVDPTHEQELFLQELPTTYNVKEVVNGFTVSAPKDKLYDLLYSLSCKYDIELV